MLCAVLLTKETVVIDNLPNIPEKLSIARMLLDAWIEEK